MSGVTLHELLRDAEGLCFRFTFLDGEELFAEVVSATHIDDDGSVILLGVGAGVDKCGWQVRLDDLRAVTDAADRPLYVRE